MPRCQSIRASLQSAAGLFAIYPNRFCKTKISATVFLKKKHFEKDFNTNSDYCSFYSLGYGADL